MMSSYVVSSTLKRHGVAPSAISLSQMALRASGEPLYVTVTASGIHLRHSSCQLESTASGTMTMKGPATFFDSIR